MSGSGSAPTLQLDPRAAQMLAASPAAGSSAEVEAEEAEEAEGRARGLLPRAAPGGPGERARDPSRRRRRALAADEGAPAAAAAFRGSTRTTRRRSTSGSVWSGNCARRKWPIRR